MKTKTDYCGKSGLGITVVIIIISSNNSALPLAVSPPWPNEKMSKMQRRMSTIREYKFFRSFSAKVDNWPLRKAEAIWRKMRERKIAGNKKIILNSYIRLYRDHPASETLAGCHISRTK